MCVIDSRHRGSSGDDEQSVDSDHYVDHVTSQTSSRRPVAAAGHSSSSRLGGQKYTANTPAAAAAASPVVMGTHHDNVLPSRKVSPDFISSATLNFN